MKSYNIYKLGYLSSANTSSKMSLIFLKDIKSNKKHTSVQASSLLTNWISEGFTKIIDS